MKLVVPTILLLNSIHAKPVRSEANATEPVAPNINYPRPRLMSRGLTEADAKSIEPPQQIVGGEDTGGPVDYMVGLGKSADGADNYDVSCGGTLIAPRFVLTAAHCMGYVNRVFVNLYDQTDSAATDVEVIEFGADDYVIHPDFAEIGIQEYYENDIALIRLPHAVKDADTIQYPKLNEESDEPEDGDSLSIMGWGDTSFGGDPSDVLLQAEVAYVTNDVCSSKYDSLGWDITDDMMCAAAAGKDTCQGDSGGPLMLNNDDNNPVLVGVVSFGNECANPDYPGVYARVSHFADWIKKQTKCARKGEFCPCSGSDNSEYLMVQAGGYNPDISVEVLNTCGDNPKTILSRQMLVFKAMCVPEGQYVFNIEDPSPGFFSGYNVHYGNKVFLLGGAFSPTGVFDVEGSFGTSATHVLGSCSKSKSKAGKSRAPRAKKTTIQASLNKSGASYPGSSGGLIGVVLALNVLIVSFFSTVM